MMNVLSENIDAVAELKKVHLWQLNRFWTPEKIIRARDQILTAISDRRHGDVAKWEQLQAMEPTQWINWLSGLPALEKNSN